MNWFKENAVAIFIGICSLIITYTTTTAMYGYRITALEDHAVQVDQEIAALNTGNVNTQVSLAQINTKLEYISAQLAKITN